MTTTSTTEGVNSASNRLTDKHYKECVSKGGLNRESIEQTSNNTGTNTLLEKLPVEQNVSTQQVSLEWIESLSPELKDAALFRFLKLVESKPTLCESFTLNQVLYRTITGGKFTESACNVAARTGCDRKTILKGLRQAVEQNILQENKRPGTSSEYFFKPVEEWLPEPVVHNMDIRTQTVIKFPKIQNTQSVENEQVVHNMDDQETDTNNDLHVVYFKEEEQLVDVHTKDTQKTSYWKYVGQGLPRVYVAPELDQDTGMRIESIHQATSRPRQFILKDAVELLYNKLNHISKVEVDNSKPESSISQASMSPVSNLLQKFGKSSVEVIVSLELSKTLEMIGVNLPGQLLHKCVASYGEDVMLNAANELQRTGVLANKENPTGYYLGCLKNGMGQQKSPQANNLEPEFEEPQSKPKCSTGEMTQSMKPECSFSHAETNPRVTVATLIIDGQYQRAAIVAGLYGVDYEELVKECGIDDPNATILVKKVTR